MNINGMQNYLIRKMLNKSLDSNILNLKGLKEFLEDNNFKYKLSGRKLESVEFDSLKDFRKVQKFLSEQNSEFIYSIDLSGNEKLKENVTKLDTNFEEFLRNNEIQYQIIWKPHGFFQVIDEIEFKSYDDYNKAKSYALSLDNKSTL